MAIDYHFGLDALQKFQRLLGLLGFVALVVLPQHAVAVRLDSDRLHRGGSHIEPDQEPGLVIVRPLRADLALYRSNLGFERGDLNQLGRFMVVHYSVSSENSAMVCRTQRPRR